MSNEEYTQNEPQPQAGCCPIVDAAANVRRLKPGSLLVGFLVGVAVTAAAVWTLMPGMMITSHASRLGFDETVAALEAATVEQGWKVSAVRDLTKSIQKHGGQFDRRVKLVEICHPDHAASVLTTDRHLGTLMPCALAVYETDDGTVRVSSMNTGLMGRMFGGNVAKVMAGQVAPAEKAILSAVVGD